VSLEMENFIGLSVLGAKITCSPPGRDFQRMHRFPKRAFPARD
jgi:hypothetical protein